jgi:hypothetical protein
MVGELVMLPLRVGVRATQLWLRAAEQTVAVAANATGRLFDAVTSRDSRVAPDARAPEVRDVAEPTEPEDVAVPTEPTASAAVSTEPAAAAHVSEEPVLVEELAEPGAEEGAGPEVHVEEPWDGYESMNAKDVIARLAGSDPAELAAVALYERGHRGRHTVLAAVERELRGNGGAARIEKERTDA